MWSRIYLTPLLQAEEDRDQVRRWYADQAREKELLGSNSSAYNSDRYVYTLLYQGGMGELEEWKLELLLPKGVLTLVVLS
jgi:hypothetical protein